MRQERTRERLCVLAANSSTGENVPQPIPTLPTRPFLFGTGPQAVCDVTTWPTSIDLPLLVSGREFWKRRVKQNAVMKREETWRTRAGHAAYKDIP